MLTHRLIPVLLALTMGSTAMASRTVRLPDYLCGGNDSIFADAYETGGVFSSDPSQGSGGGYPGSISRTFTFAPFGQQTYYLYVPARYQPGQAMPLMVVLEGYTGSHTASVQQAQVLRDDWIAAASAYGFIIAAPVNNTADGSWIPADGTAQANDYDMIGAMIDDVAQAWNIERNRISVWGFSAGGSIAWDMLLNDGRFAQPTPLSAATLASMSIAAANSSFACSLDPTPCTTRFANLPRKVPVGIHIGTSDPNHAGAANDFQRLLSNGWQPGRDLDYEEFTGGHTFTLAHLQEVAGFACGFALDP